MRFWVELPLEQWIEIHEERHHAHPWSVVIGGFVRARYTTREEAETLVAKLHQAFEEPER